MSLLDWLLPFRSSAAPAEPRLDRGRFEAGLAELRAEQARAQAELAGRLDGVLGELGKLGREQFQATTLLEGQGMALDELTEAGREHLGQHERTAADVREALGELETQVRLRLVKDLLPVADALDASLRAARELPLVVEPAQPALDDSWLARLRLVLAGPPADPTPTTPAPATDRRTALDSWLQGLLLVERRLQALLEREGVRPIAALGQPFDPYRHLAVAVAGNGSGAVPDGTIVGEELRGYTYGDRVLRHAEVVVARNQVTHDRGARVGIKGPHDHAESPRSRESEVTSCQPRELRSDA